MPLEFGQQQPPDAKTKRKSPPNYSSRRVQWKVFMYVAMFMLVIILMQEAGKPERWQWMWQLQRTGDTQTAQVEEEEDVDTRLRAPDDTLGSGADADLIIIGSDQELSDVAPAEDDVAKEELESTNDRDPIEHSRHDAWSRLLKGLSDDDKPQFLKGLKAARNQTTLPEDERESWSRIVGLLDEGWQKYLNDAFVAVNQDNGGLNDAEKKIWVDVIQRLRIDWNDRTKPSLEAIGGDEPPNEEQQQTLADVQRTLDGVFLDGVRDNTVFRAAEHDAWFRLLEDLDRRDAEELRESSTGHVGFLQLYRQPKVYRGKLVTVRGQLKLGHHRQSQPNIYGIADYYHLWLVPTGSTSPIKICCLEIPEGFPDVRGIEAAGEKPVLAEDAEITGYFFKRWAYRAVDGTRLAPVLLAKIPQWEPQADSPALATELPGAALWTMIIGGSCLLGIGVTALIFLLNSRSMPQKERPERVQIPSHIDSKQ